MKKILSILILFVGINCFSQKQRVHMFSHVTIELGTRMLGDQIECRVFENYGGNDKKLKVYGMTTTSEEFDRLTEWKDVEEAYGVRYKEAEFAHSSTKERVTIRIHYSAAQIVIITEKGLIRFYTPTNKG